jgi:hypothetical protein
VTYTTEIKTGVFHDLPLPDFVRNYDRLVAQSQTLCQVFTNTDVIRPVFDIDCSVATEAEMHAAASRFTGELIPQFTDKYFCGAKYNKLSKGYNLHYLPTNRFLRSSCAHFICNEYVPAIF